MILRRPLILWPLLLASVGLLAAASFGLSTELRAGWWAMRISLAHALATGDWRMADRDLFVGAGFLAAAGAAGTLFIVLVVRRLVDRTKNDRHGFSLEKPTTCDNDAPLR